MHNFLGIIAARKKSIRIKNKNLEKLGKKKLIEYTFSSAKKSKKLDKIFLSTDDTKIIKLAKRYNIKAPFLRPSSISTSKTKMETVVLHSLKFYKKKYNILPKNFVILQPTSPFRTQKDIDNSINKYKKLKSKSLVSVSKPLNPVEEIFIISKRKLGKNLKKFKNNSLFLNGSIYIRNTREFLKQGILISKNSNYFVTKKINSIDINDKMDLSFAKSLIK